MRSEPLEHDWPPTIRPRRPRKFETVEILPPEQPRRVRADITIRRGRRIEPPSVGVAALCAFVLFLFLLMFRLGPVPVLVGIVVLVSYVSPDLLAAIALVVVVVVVASWWHKRRGLPF